MVLKKIELDVLTMQDLFGVADNNVKELEKELGDSLITRGGDVEISGSSEEAVVLAVDTLQLLNQMRE